jgi:hypothetical protein
MKQSLLKEMGIELKRTDNAPILKDCLGSPDGIRVIQFKEGQIVDLPNSLVEPFLSIKAIEKVETKEEKKNSIPEDEVQESKMIKEAEDDESKTAEASSIDAVNEDER